MTRFLWIIAGSLAALFVSFKVGAQSPAGSFPSKPVTMVVPFDAGGPTDTEARLYAAKLSDLMGRRFIVEARPGAGTVIGTRYVASAPPDGHTLLVTTGTFTSIGALGTDSKLDVVRDFAAVSLMSSQPQALLARPGFPARDFAEYLAYARANSDKVTWGTAGAGSITHLVGAWLNGLGGSKVTFVHYKGTGAIALDLMGDRLDVGLQFLSAALPNIKAGKVRALAVLGKMRSSALPELPTISERGIAGFDFANWLGIVAPARTAPEIVEKLGTALAVTVKSPEISTRLEASGATPVGSSPAQFKEMVQRESERWKKVVQDNNIVRGDP